MRTSLLSCAATLLAGCQLAAAVITVDLEDPGMRWPRGKAILTGTDELSFDPECVGHDSI